MEAAGQLSQLLERALQLTLSPIDLLERGGRDAIGLAPSLPYGLRQSRQPSLGPLVETTFEATPFLVPRLEDAPA